MLDFLLLIAIAAAVVFAYRALAARMPDNTSYRFAAGIALAAAFMLFWINGAVGVIGNENNDANMMYVGVIAIGMVGSIIARFQPRGMALAMIATAVAQLIVAIIALIGDLGASGPIWPKDVLILTAFFSVLWAASALLFRAAARKYIHTATGRATDS